MFYANKEIEFVRFQVAEPLDSIFLRCNWRGKNIKCENYFKKVLTQEGVCYNFNSLAADDILHLDV